MSPCPNDTFAFWAALHGEVTDPHVRLELAMLDDVEALNRRATGPLAERLDVTKLSLPALAAAIDDYAILPSGAALGFGCGPLVVRRANDDRHRTLEDLRGSRVAIPGERTTAFLLFSTFASRDCTFVPMRFHQILAAVANGEVDAGLVIHESRFTYAAHGLALVADLGQLWEQATNAPLPLGVIAIRRHLGRACYDATASLLRASVQLAQQDPTRARPFVRQHSQEMNDDVCDQHIALYVNERTKDLGDEGRRAIDAMLQRGRATGLLPHGRSPWWGDA